MKVLDRIALVVFSTIMLIESILFGFIIFGWIHIDIVTVYIKGLLDNQTVCNSVLGLLAIFIILAIDGIFFSSSSNKNKEKDKNIDNGILIQTDNGKLLISRDTIQNLVSGVVQGFENTQDVTSKVILTSDNNINIDVTLFVTQDAVIKDLSNKLQIKIKDVIKQSIDIDIKEVNIKVRNITPKEEIIEN